VLPTVSELYTHGMETAASASLNFVVAQSESIIQAKEIKNPVAFDPFYHFEGNTRKKRSKRFNYTLCEKQKNLSNNINLKACF